VGRTPEREAVFDFTVPYLTMHGAIVVRQGATGINSLSDPRGRRVAVMKGDNAEEFLRREDRGLDILTTPTFTEAFQILSTGRCEAVVVQRLVALRLLAENRLTHLRIVEQPIQGFSQDFCFAVREGDRDLLALLNEGLALVVADGTHRRLHAKWFAALELPSNRPVIIGGDHNYPPFEYLDEKGKPAGFTVELTRAIARELNLNVQFRLGPWAEAVEALRQGEIDAIGGMFYSAKRDQALDFSPRYLVIHCVSVVRRGAGVPPGAFEELAGRDLVVQAEDAILDTMRERDIKARITTVETQEEVVRAVAEGRHECGLVIRLGALHAIRKHGWTNLVVGDRTLYSGDYCFAVPAGRTALLAEFSEGLHALEQSGEYHSIYEKWLGAYEPDPPAWRRGMKSVVLVAVPLLTIAMLALAWSWNLRRQVAQRTAELADQYRLLRVAGQTARFGGWSVELATQQCTWSDTVADIHEMPSGFSPTVEEGIGYYASEWREKIRQVFAACARDGTPYDEELEILTARGKRVWVRTTGEAVRDESGKIMRVQGSFQEITARKHAEEAMRTAAQSYRRLFDANPQPMWIYDLESLRFLAVNDLAVDRYGYTRDEFLQMTLKDIQPAEDVPRLLDNAARSTGEVQESGLGRHRKKNGEVILIEIASHSLHWMGHPARVVLAHDVTAHERSRQELQSSEERFRRAVVDSPFPILLHAEDGAILQVSNSWCEITGYTREELATVSDWTERAYGEKWTLVQAEIDALYRLDHRKYEGDYTIRTRSGAMRVWEFSSAPLGRLPDGRRLVISMALDVTERRAAEAAARRALARVEASRKVLLNVVEDRKRAEAEVRQLNASLEQRVAARTAQLEAANKELEAFCYSVSHDLRAPLRGIDGWSLALLEDCGGQLDAQGRQHLARVRSETQRMGQLIDDLLALSRVTRCDLCPGPVDLSALAQRSAARLRQAAPGRAVELLIQPGLETQGDARLLEAALTNLLDNAWKFTGKRAAARIEFGRLEQQGAPVYFVRDNGAGFDPAHARKLFAPFQRLHRAEDFPGTGVGLATVQRILARHGGRIWAEAQVDRGATFFFTLAEEGCIMQNA
jgi:PAS domain S-box-containing protein